MPTYDYKCSDCGRVFEKFHGMNEKPQINCPECSSANTTRQISLGAGIVFKGAGFYVNDYKKSDGSSGAGSTTTTTTAAKAGGEAKPAESAPATESTTKSAHVHGPGCSHG